METFDIESFLAKTKPEVGAIIKARCTHSEHAELKLLLNHFLSPSSPIDDENVLDWLGWIMAGGSTPDEFCSTVRLYDKSTTCGLVWSENTVAYRCRTCGISPCMSLCAECFHHGNHQGHDFIVFRSETGGACDCGEINIIKESGCCSFHGPRGSHSLSLQQRGGQGHLSSQNVPNSRSARSDSSSSSNDQSSAPPDLLSIANGMMPHLFHRLILSMREEHWKRMENPVKIKPIIMTCKHNVENNNDIASSILIKGHKFIKMLQGFADMGVAMRQVMINTLTESNPYGSLVKPLLLPKGIGGAPNFNSFLEELVYWTVNFEFPEDLICLLLSMRSDFGYKEDFTRAFVLHYNLISETILRSGDPLTLCKHVAAVSVQLFSIETLAIQMVETMNLLPLLVNTLHNMINQAIIVNPKSKTKKAVLDCDSDIMKNNYYWPIKSDLKELLSHEPVAAKFFQDEPLLGGWFQFLSHFQGMNLATYIHKGNPHIEQETETHIGAFTAELEISATPMWTLLSHLKDSSTSHFTVRIVHHILQVLSTWSEAGGAVPRGQVSFHLPLHRNLSSFIRQGLLHQGLSIEELVPPHSLRHAMLPPIGQQLIRLHSTFYQILGRLWSRNGAEILNQAESYVNSLCCNSMIDADLFLLQTVAGCIPRDDFLSLVFEEFQAYNSLGLLPSNSLDPEEQNTMVESCLLFLATLTSSRINLGMSDENLMALEMSTLLCKGDKLHSELLELLPERCGSDSQIKNFEKVLSHVADFQSPRQMHQGKYVPKPSVWENWYDPIHTMMRSSNRAEFQVSLDRYQDFAKRSNLVGSSSTNLWPPFRTPSGNDSELPLPDPQLLLSSNLMLEILFVVFFRAVHLGNVPNFTISLAVYLLELAISPSSVGNIFSNEENYTAITTSSKSQLSIYPSADFVSNLVKKVNLSSWLDQTYINKCVPEESIISLLLQLHTQFKDNSSTYTLPETTIHPGSESRVGDGAYFIGNLLTKLSSRFPPVHSFLVSETAVVDHTGEQSMEKEREERRKRAKERKLQLMTELAMKRQQFMKMNEDASSSVEENVTLHPIGESGSGTECEFECVICMEKGGSKFENPYGLITYLMPSSVLSHRNAIDPCGSVGGSAQPFGVYWRGQAEEFGKYFDESSIRLSLPLHYGNGVSIQTCGHYLHTDCFNSYLNSLKKTKSHALNQREVVALSHKKFSCPLCRQLGNSFLPIIKDALGTTINLTQGDPETDENELTRVLKKRSTLVLSPKQKLGVEKFLDDIQKIVTFTKMREIGFGVNNSSSSAAAASSANAQSLSLVFLNALEMESLKCKSNPDLHRSYLLPLYSVLRYSYKSLPTGHSKRISQIWEGIVGTASKSCGSTSSKTPQREIPILLRDPNVLLSHLMLQLPYGTEKKYLKIITQKLMTLKLVQILVGLCTQLDPEDLECVKNSSIPTPFQPLLHRVVEHFSTSSRFIDLNQEEMMSVGDLSPSIISSLLRNAVDLESFISKRMTPFVNKVMEWSSTVSRNPDPDPNSMDESHDLDVVPQDDVQMSLDYTQAIPQSQLDFCLSAWMEELLPHKSDISSLFMTQLISWDKPKLKEIPNEYDKIFQSYRKLKCTNCNTIPSEPALCLLCGTIVCLNSFCCLDKQSKVSEVIQHSNECGMGSAVFLCVTSSAILVVANIFDKEACVWGSVFLDSFGEEDLDLRRGKPLFLSKERFQFLQRQWATHSFHKYELKWFPHDNML